MDQVAHFVELHVGQAVVSVEHDQIAGSFSELGSLAVEAQNRDDVASDERSVVLRFLSVNPELNLVY